MRIKSIFVWLFIGTLSLSMVPAAIAKEEVIGHIARLSGIVDIKKAKKTYWSNARINMKVYFGDNIRTGDDGSGLIRLVDDSIIRIQSNSHIVLNTIISPVEKKNSVLLFFGKIWNKVSKRALRKKVFEVQTPTAVCGVRGTDFETASYDDGTMLVKVNTGNVEVDNETSRKSLSANQGTRVEFGQKEIVAEADYKPDWERSQEEGTENLLSDGKKYGGYVHDEIYKRRDEMKQLVNRATDLTEKKERLKAAAGEAQKKGDLMAAESFMGEVKKIGEEQKELNKKIAYYARRLECHFGLFSHYGDIAKHPVLSKRFQGKEFILNQLDDIELVHAEFNAMVEEGMKMSMGDMEDMMDEMRDKMKIFKDKKAGKDIFGEME
jgi:hypothetical protein